MNSKDPTVTALSSFDGHGHSGGYTTLGGSTTLCAQRHGRRRGSGRLGITASPNMSLLGHVPSTARHRAVPLQRKHHGQLSHSELRHATPSLLHGPSLSTCPAGSSWAC